MKTFRSVIITFSLLLLAAQVWASPIAPEVTITTSGLSVSISWTEVPDADGYNFYYVQYPYTGVEPIGTIDAGKLTEANFYLWENAAFYVAVTAYNTSGTSAFSNIPHFVMGPPTPEWVDDDGDGFIEVDGDCDDGNASINPKTEEICGDGIDQDCSGADEVCPVDPNDVGNSCPEPRVVGFCTSIYFPVCGLLNNGERKSYSNECEACNDLNVTGYIQIQGCQ